MKIKIIGKNSSNRTKLLKNTNKALKKFNNGIEIMLLEEKEDENKYGITNTPSLIIDDKIVSQGKVLTDREIINYIRVLS